ncbi:GGDEF domain-containing protein [Actinoplanes utahensis]|uniref:Uncharacterized protein n=1 Tax=Actinoplanes utahensis TaxID=1869 RepID=A0A0A6XDE7_ACTUT|nr:GGDEF domain-containing protein [Actinoplanes utahensis]KHD78122.1 hypothetical protein MB27_06525 [Actinoplanes utahensis]
MIAEAGWVPGRRDRPLAAVRDVLRQLVCAVESEPFEPEPGRRAGVQLVKVRMADPRVLGAAVRLLADRLPALFPSDGSTSGRERDGSTSGRQRDGFASGRQRDGSTSGRQGDGSTSGRERDGSTGDRQRDGFVGDRGAVTERVLRVLEQMINGFGAALRDTAMRAGDDMHRAIRLAWENEKAMLEIELQHARLHDPVTHLPNRNYLREQLRRTIEAAGGHAADRDGPVAGRRLHRSQRRARPRPRRRHVGRDRRPPA